MDRGHARHLGDIECALSELVEELDPDAVPLCEAPRMWQQFDRVERLAASAKILLARRVDQSGEWKRKGRRSAAEQLADDAGTSVSSAKSMLETSKRVAKQPKTARSMRKGELSSAKAEVVSAAAAVAPGEEGRLLALAKRSSLATLRDEGLRTKAAVDGDETHARIRKERYARDHTDAEGAWNFHARGTAEDGARFRAVWEPMVDERFNRAYQAGEREPREAYAFDAFIDLADRAAQPADADADADNPTARKRTSPKFLALVRVDHEALRRGAVEGDEVCEISGLGPIPVRVARDLLGDAIVKIVITQGVQVINVTSLRRSATMAQQIALWWQSPECQVLDCTRTRLLENDHREEWCKTHVTEVGNLDPLCGHHHWLKTVHGWALVDGTGKREIVPPDDPRHPNYRRGRPPPDP